MPEETEVILRYVGPDVDDGSIGVDDLLSALNGFSNAFYKVADRIDLDRRQRIKVTQISQSSANIHLTVYEIGGAVALAVGGGTIEGVREAAKNAVVKIADTVIERISGVAKVKKHTQGGKFSVTQTGDGNTVIVNNLNVPLPVTKEVLELLQEGTIDADLDKLTAPLREEAIDGFEIRHDSKTVPDLSLTASDRPYFAKPRRAKTETKSMVMLGTLTSINKSNNSGIFISEFGKKIRFKFTNEDKLAELYRMFAHLGMVQVDCVAKLDENLDVISIDISDIRPN